MKTLNEDPQLPEKVLTNKVIRDAGLSKLVNIQYLYCNILIFVYSYSLHFCIFRS